MDGCHAAACLFRAGYLPQEPAALFVSAERGLAAAVRKWRLGLLGQPALPWGQGWWGTSAWEGIGCKQTPSSLAGLCCQLERRVHPEGLVRDFEGCAGGPADVSVTWEIPEALLCLQ